MATNIKNNIGRFFLLFIIISLFSCKQKKDILLEVKKDVEYLSDDKLQGRETGTIGEDLALIYLNKRFKKIGLQTKIDTFQFNDFVEVKFNTDFMHCEIDFTNIYPTKYSSNATISNVEVIDLKFGIKAPEFDYSDYKNKNVIDKAVLINTSSPDGIHPHSKYLNHHDLKDRVETAKEEGAQCVIFYTDDKHAETPTKKFKKIKESGIPVLFLNDHKEILLNKRISFELNLGERKTQGKNLIAYINNQQQSTIVMGAHYDHIGWGKEGSRYIGELAIHNGADDNASGVAALIQLAKFYNQRRYNSYNYIFIAFSGEEKGLLGSNAYVKKTDQELNSFNCMINLDMVGRLDTGNTLQIYGTGTSPSWNDLIDTNNIYGFNIKKSKSGTGPSDHTTFYLQDIPVLHFFTGAHEDYHKPSDDAEKINYQGIIKIIYFIQNIINDLHDAPTLAFTKTKEENNKNRPRFSVTLGVMPDYLFDGEGMRIDGVSHGRPAEVAKIKKGDVVIKLGEIRVSDMTTYMQALGAHSKGDRVDVIVIRDNEELTFSVQF
jgi:aminopeptidase YwaD